MSTNPISRRAWLLSPLLAKPRPSGDLHRASPAVMTYAHREQVRQNLNGNRQQPLEATASIDEETCLPFCSVCIEHCPVPGALTLIAGRILVDPTACNGCGACVPVCPSPASPIRLVPRQRGAHSDSSSGSEGHKRDNARDVGGAIRRPGVEKLVQRQGQGGR